MKLINSKHQNHPTVLRLSERKNLVIKRSLPFQLTHRKQQIVTARYTFKIRKEQILLKKSKILTNSPRLKKSSLKSIKSIAKKTKNEPIF